MKLFVGNLPFETTEAELREFFSEHGPVLEYTRPVDRETGQPRGFAFVTLPDRDAGEAAIAALDGEKIDGRKLKINEAEDRGFQRRPRQDDDYNLDDLTAGTVPRVDDRPTDKDGNKVTYKSI